MHPAQGEKEGKSSVKLFARHYTKNSLYEAFEESNSVEFGIKLEASTSFPSVRPLKSFGRYSFGSESLMKLFSEAASIQMLTKELLSSLVSSRFK